jgi:hypothetical protein
MDIALGIVSGAAAEAARAATARFKRRVASIAADRQNS